MFFLGAGWAGGWIAFFFLGKWLSLFVLDFFVVGRKVYVLLLIERCNSEFNIRKIFFCGELWGLKGGLGWGEGWSWNGVRDGVGMG